MKARRPLRPRYRWLTVVVAALALTSCSPAGSDVEGQMLPEYEPVPSRVNQPAPEVDTADLRIPLQLEQNRMVDPDWQTPPHYVDDVFLSAADADNVLTFRAVDSSGTILWEAQRPLSCTGFTLSSANERHYAVLTDIEGDEQTFGETVASAYDLHTGETMWGPVNVPGPHQGPGTVFAAPPEEAMGEAGPKVVLDPATGDVLLDEHERSDIRILGEFHGTVLTADDHHVQAHSHTALAESGLAAEPVWTLELAEYGWQLLGLTAASPVTTTAPTSGAALIGTDDTNRALVELGSGDVIATELADAGQDPSSSTWITIGQQLAGYDAQGQQLYAQSHDDLELVGVGGAMAYMKNSDAALQVHNVVTGDIGRAYDPEATGVLAMPTVISPNGTGVLDTGEQYYLAPVEG